MFGKTKAMPLSSQIFSALVNVAIFKKDTLFVSTSDGFIFVILKLISKFKCFNIECATFHTLTKALLSP